MTTITIMRRMSGFANVPDWFEVRQTGSYYDEIDGWREETYVLPAGYTVAETTTGEMMVFGPTGRHACEIVEHATAGRPQLFGERPKAPVLERAVEPA